MFNLTKRQFLLGAGAGAAAVTLGACGGNDGGDGAGGGDSLTLTLGHAGSMSDTRQWAAERFAELAEERSDGRITVDVHADATLGTWEEMMDGLQLGTVDIVVESILATEAYTDLAAVETAPFLYDSDEQFFAVWEGDLGAEIKDAITADSGYQLIGDMFRGSRQLSTKNPVTSLANLQGLTIRTPSAQTMVDTWNTLGARAEALPFSEVYSALESGVLDAQENPLDLFLHNSFYEVNPHVTDTRHMFANYHFIFWDETFAGYADDLRAIIEEVGAEVGQEFTQNTQDDLEQYQVELEELGTQFHALDDRSDWVETTQPVIEGLSDQVQDWVEQIRSM